MSTLTESLLQRTRRYIVILRIYAETTERFLNELADRVPQWSSQKCRNRSVMRKSVRVSVPPSSFIYSRSICRKLFRYGRMNRPRCSAFPKRSLDRQRGIVNEDDRWCDASPGTLLWTIRINVGMILVIASNAFLPFVIVTSQRSLRMTTGILRSVALTSFSEEYRMVFFNDSSDCTLW